MANLKVPVGPADHALGDENAPVTLVEYGDYECPHCGRAHPIVHRVRKHFGKSLRFVFRNFPLTQIHPNAEMAAEAAEFAATKGRFWEMHDGIYENQAALGGTLVADLAGQLGLPMDELETALKSREFLPKVKKISWAVFAAVSTARRRSFSMASGMKARGSMTSWSRRLRVCSPRKASIGELDSRVDLRDLLCVPL